MLKAQQLKQALSDELESILHFWMTETIDEINGGYTGKIDNDGNIDQFADKGSVLNARILWTFSAAYNATKNGAYLDFASRAFNYIRERFIDETFGGIYWTVTYNGNLSETKKQVYAQAFAIYACSEYFKATGNMLAKSMAIDLFKLIEKHSYDVVNGGYFEAFTREWKEIDDQRLSEKDANEKKTMNTHLHILEAYSTLYAIWPDNYLKEKITHLLDIFYHKIINQNNWHLHLFFDEQWNVKGDHISYGHDIEASWLLQEAAEAIHDNYQTEKFKEAALKMADATFEGIDKDGGLWYEYKPTEKILIKEKHWWPQAEAIVGFINAWQISTEEKYLQAATNNWQFVQQHILDAKKGEWFWGVNENYSTMLEDKAGLWKCPYHNSRACLEVMKRL
jgi:mannobiose 2-epimerase